jgi:hypothetical protein
MKHETKGSIVLLVLIIMSILMVLMHTALTRESFLRMTVIKRASQEKNFALCRSLLRYGVRTAQDHFIEITKKAEEIVLEIPLEQNKGTIFLTPASEGITKGITIRSELWQENILMSKYSCRLTQNTDKKYIIEGFQR